MACSKSNGYAVGILVVSDTVSRGEKEDASGKNLKEILNNCDCFNVASILNGCVPDDRSEIESILKLWADEKNIDLILTVGGTGFSPRDITPEATKAVIEREAVHIASYMVMGCTVKTKFAALSRSVCGIRGKSLILNLPGSTKGSAECFEMVAPILPHALDQLRSDVNKITSAHVEIQGKTDDRTCYKSN